ncbi:VapC toxin family PIN domain ribonuclease [candidate division KSB1 bacterium]|nr:MAG: VapC toxin family PIN domain ribonuclease [candidate division KSB1 bacterium]
MIYVIDTNIITAVLKGKEKVKRKIQGLIFEGNKIFINCISYYEIKRGLLAVKAKSQLKRFEKLCEKLGLILLDNPVIFDEASEIYADLKQKGKLINDADILIAAITKSNNHILVSDDTDFERIEGLKIENWLK